MHLSRYLKAYPLQSRPDHFLIFSTLRSSTVVVPSATLRAAEAGTLSGSDAETLKRLGMLTEDPLAEREQMRGFLDRLNANNRRFDVIVMLNLDCNLQCQYCYEDAFRGEYYMSETTADLLVETLVRERLQAGMDLRVTFYGGEPLLSEPLLKKISQRLQKAASEHKVDYGFALVTNGTLLTREAVLRLLPLGLRGAKVTLDGPREVHDLQRPYRSGSGSFDAIVDNVSEICDLISIAIGGNFYRDNYHLFPLLLDQLLERGVTGERVSQVLFTPITPKAGCAEYSHGCTCSDEPWLFDAFVYLRKEILTRGFATGKPTVSACMVELPDSVVVNCDGSLYKCPAFMGWDGFSIGALGQGMQDCRDSHRIGNWQNDTCLDCPYLPICFGGCRFMKLLQGKDVSEVDCRRKFLDATLETFILQNIAYPRKKKDPKTTG